MPAGPKPAITAVAVRDTMRELLNRLVCEGLIVAEGQRGFEVAPVSPTEFHKIGALRLVLESHATAQSVAGGDLDSKAGVVAAHHKLSVLETRMLREVDADPVLWEQCDRAFHKALISACGSWALMDQPGRIAAGRTDLLAPLRAARPGPRMSITGLRFALDASSPQAYTPASSERDRPMRKKRGRPLNGWLIIDKPPGMTSTDVVNRVKRGFDAQKAGHGGTLDPLATGVLPIAFGHATKTVPYVMDGTKLYRFTLRLGDARDTDDADGATIATSDVRPTDDQLRAALPAFVGNIMQVPPIYSAIKVAGERAYDMAREGRAPDLPPRPARVDRFELIERPDADTAVFEVQSGKGVYMRSLARDLAVACGTVGHIAALRRLRVGPFTEEQAISLEQCVAGEEPPSPALILPVATALGDIPALALTEAEGFALSQGQPISLVDLMGRIPEGADPEGGLARAMSGARVLGLCRLEGGMLRPERML